MTAISESSDVIDPREVTLGALFVGFLKIGLLGFGGVLAWARWLIVEQRRWLDAAEFTDMLALAQFLPGPNVGNLSVVLGARFHGARGAAVSLIGLFALPAACVVLLGALYDRFATEPVVARALPGLAAAASGLVVATAVKIALPLRARGLGALAVAAATLAIVVLLRLPMPLVLLAMVPVSVALAARTEGA